MKIWDRTQNKMQQTKRYYKKKFQKISMELEYHGKLDFTKFENLKSGTSLHISETMIDYNIICKKMLFGYFRQQNLPKIHL